MAIDESKLCFRLFSIFMIGSIHSFQFLLNEFNIENSHHKVIPTFRRNVFSNHSEYLSKYHLLRVYSIDNTYMLRIVKYHNTSIKVNQEEMVL